MSEQTIERPRRTVAAELSKFQEVTLLILSEEARYGLAIKRELETYYDDDVNHGRLYPNLDALVELGLVEKSELDRRTNEYAITDTGRDVLLAQIEWAASKLDEIDADLLDIDLQSNTSTTSTS